jgi:hypothetical protein
VEKNITDVHNVMRYLKGSLIVALFAIVNFDGVEKMSWSDHYAEVEKMSWLDHYDEQPLKLRWKLFAIFLGIVGGLTLWLILEWYYGRKKRM